MGVLFMSMIHTGVKENLMKNKNMTLKYVILVLCEEQLKSGGVTQDVINLVVQETRQTFHMYQETINFVMWT